jgi:hypothetical protein
MNSSRFKQIFSYYKRDEKSLIHGTRVDENNKIAHRFKPTLADGKMRRPPNDAANSACYLLYCSPEVSQNILYFSKLTNPFRSKAATLHSSQLNSKDKFTTTSKD